MKTFGKTMLPERIASTGSLTEMVRCTDTIPSAGTSIVGTLYHLAQPQVGFKVDHIYLCVYDTSLGYNVWRDLTENDSITPDSSVCIASGYMVEWDGIMIRLNAIWTSPPDDGADTWVRDIVIRKLDGYPTNLLDGEHITSSIIRDQYSSLASQYQSGPTTVDPTGHDYKYRVFHVFSSGKITYTDMTDVSIGGYFAVGSMGRDTTDTYIGSHNEVLLVWRTPSIFTTADWSYDIIDVGGTTVLDTRTSTYYAVTGGADKIARYKGTVKTSAEVTVTSHFADGSTVTVPLVRTDVWMWLKSVAELAC